ncbi:hydroxyacylglutathione hydrolase [Phanerochaete sordida]|uniref:hydroxyacylglutathione hydrolase n=1 Tax=Phanerochaete sordida TaxID=48140 RepID=A0A9P3G2B2_9APHY|nr:hydroxyacylglutathione hydrolase [Phanerochaete sordida]
MKVIPVPVRDDNYAYLLVDEKSGKALAVDPYDVPKVQGAAAQAGVDLAGSLTTHHHHDHSGGNKAFLMLTAAIIVTTQAGSYPSVPIYGGSNQAPAVTNLVKDKDEITFGNITIRCLHTPCHTQDSICYYATPNDGSGSHPGAVFTGDTLFVAGCGRFFEGTAPEMRAALTYLGTLPDTTLVYNGHEYTKGNLAFAKSVEPDNEALQRIDALLKQSPATTGVSTIGDEKEWNPFIRLGSASIRKNIDAANASDDDVMQKLRELKNNFRG